MAKYMRSLRAVGVLVLAFITSFSMLTVPVYAKKVPPTPPKVFILVPGITSALTQADIDDNFTPGFEAVKIAIIQAVPEAQFITYSYNGPMGKKKPEPKPYACGPTLDNTIRDDILLLDKQVQAVVAKQSNAEIYLVGHSLGGVIAFGYMAALTAIDPAGTPLMQELPNNNLKGVVTLDSPLGGIRGDDPYFFAVQGFLNLLCPGTRVGDVTATVGLRELFNSPLFSVGGHESPLGSAASTLAITFPDNTILPPPYNANQATAKKAYVDMGTRTLTIGNKRDMLWDPLKCGLNNNQFIWTQWIEDREIENIGVYGRYIDTGDNNVCFLFTGIEGSNHLNTLSDSNVMQAIKQFINGEVPSALPHIAGES